MLDGSLISASILPLESTNQLSAYMELPILEVSYEWNTICGFVRMCVHVTGYIHFIYYCYFQIFICFERI